jgi:rhodanese-related sulfurtransferase
MSRWAQGMLLGLLLVALAGCFQRWSAEDRTPRVTKEELLALMERPETVIIDVRTGSTSKRRIKGAAREDPGTDPRTWAGKYAKDKVLVFYCA